MNLYHLRYFVTLAHLEHYTRAAEALSITQPSLSHAISALEEELGMELFAHEGRNVVLTKWGRQFLTDVEAVLTRLDRSVAQMQKLSRGQGCIDLGFLRGLGADLVPQLISAFQATAQGKGVTFHLSTAATWELMEGLDSQRYDLALSSHAPEHQKVDFLPVKAQPFVLVVPEAHPLASRSRVRLEETLSEPHILFDPSAAIRGEIDQIYRTLPHLPQIAYEIQEAQDIAGLVANGFGVAVLQESFFLQSLPVKAIPLEESAVQRYVCLAASTRYKMPPHVRAFWAFTRHWAEKNGAPGFPDTPQGSV